MEGPGEQQLVNGQVRRLIEVDLPIGVISQHARHEQNIKKGHLHSFHVWWATRPLAACRAVTLAALLPDPVDEHCPEEFRRKAQQALSWMTSRDLSEPNDLRKALLNFVGDFSEWERAIDPRWLETARSLVQAAYPNSPPLVVDPFAGIGSIPLEALRLGADAFAGDLNPVATLLLKAVLEDIPRYGERLAQAVRQWGKWVKDRAEKELQQFYPLDADGGIPLAYVWARQIVCGGPGCGAQVPLVGLVWLSRKEKHQVALRIIGDKEEKKVSFEIFEPKSEAEVQGGIVSGFTATCPVCRYTTPYARVREQLRKQQGGTNNARMIAVITLKPDGQRGFRLPSQQDLEAAERAKDELERRKQEHSRSQSLVPDEPLPPEGTLGFRVQRYGMKTWGDLFTPRQALALSTFAKMAKDAHGEILKQTEDAAFARAVATCIALAVSNLSHYSSDLSYYHPFYGMRSAFGGNGFPMKPDFAEANPFIPNLVGGFDYPLDLAARVIEREGAQPLRSGIVHLGSATAIPLPDQAVPIVITDPPYYDAVPYANLSDFCYVWLKRSVGEIHPDLFRLPPTWKAEECILDPIPPRPGEPVKDRAFFENKMREALAECRRVLTPDGVAIVLFAHKGTAGWEALLKALVEAGWTVTSSWPIETERGARMRAKNSAVLASSVFLVCRPRLTDAGVGEWRQVLAELRPRIHEWLPRLADEGIEGADAIFSCLGPALKIYSRYQRVETAGGEVIELADRKDGNGKIIERGFLSFVWEAVGTEAMRTIAEKHMEGADPLGFEEDARLTTMWLWTIRAKTNQVTSTRGEQSKGRQETRGYTLPYDDARLLIQALGADEADMKRASILEVKGDKASLLFVHERSRYLLGEAPPPRRIRPQADFLKALGMETVTEDAGALKREGTTLDRVHQAMLLFANGRSGALRRILEDADEKFSRLANALSALYPANSEEKRLVEGILARKKSLGL